MKLVLVGARLTETTYGIPHSSLIVSQRTSYILRLENPASLNATIWVLLTGDKSERAPMMKWWFAQRQISKALVYL